MNKAADPIGVVAIGRNEGDRLKRCLAALRRCAFDAIVYVDSGSADGSVAHASSVGADVVVLSPDRPFTAARARNAGFARLLEILPQVRFVQFIDGDCELAAGFKETGAAFLAAERDCGVVVGRVRELDRSASLYNRLCEMEWSGPAGDIKACGGIFMVREDAFAAVNGFNESLIAAEDDDFSIRVRQAGWRLRRLDADMCRHDAGMTRFSQWWRRAERAGHAYAQLGALHDGYFRAERRRAVAWGFLLPAAALLAAPFTSGLSLVGAAALFAASWVRTRRNLRREGAAPADASLYAAFLALSKFPNFAGIVSYRMKRRFGRRVDIVEYK